MLYRVFVKRYYIAVDYVEVESISPGRAAQKARTTVNKLRPNPRREATDNQWQADEPVVIEAVGQFGKDGKGRHPMVEHKPGIFVQPSTAAGKP